MHRKGNKQLRREARVKSLYLTSVAKGQVRATRARQVISDFRVAQKMGELQTYVRRNRQIDLTTKYREGHERGLW